MKNKVRPKLPLQNDPHLEDAPKTNRVLSSVWLYEFAFSLPMVRGLMKLVKQKCPKIQLKALPIRSNVVKSSISKSVVILNKLGVATVRLSRGAEALPPTPPQLNASTTRYKFAFPARLPALRALWTLTERSVLSEYCTWPEAATQRDLRVSRTPARLRTQAAMWLQLLSAAKKNALGSLIYMSSTSITPSEKHPPPNPAPFPNEVILNIFDHLSDAELRALAPVSIKIHELALLVHLSRYGISETEIASQDFPEMSTGGAFHAFRLARFITRPTALRLRFDPTAQIDRDVRALTSLARRLPPIPSIELHFPRRRSKAHAAATKRCNMEDLLLALIASRRSCAVAVFVSFQVYMIHPYKPRFGALRRLYSMARNIACKSAATTPPTYGDRDEARLRGHLQKLFRGDVIPSITIQLPEPPSAIGAETSAIFANLRLPILRHIEAELHLISTPAMHAFLSNNPTLVRVKFYGPPAPDDRAPHTPLVPTALPNITSIHGNAFFCAGVLQSAHAFPHLTCVTLELDDAIPLVDYIACLRGIAHRPAVRRLYMHLDAWHPWAALQEAPVERDVLHIADLHLRFCGPLPTLPPHEIPALFQWLWLFVSAPTVSLYGIAPQPLNEFLHAEGPASQFKMITPK
ncbi:hypothetical protein C8J57DRAFT_1246065 [Mycena rebaudengoi]|nr:hypothetical protein C8J57DRAFT_1246065 [Mycena rebaudengoi]